MSDWNREVIEEFRNHAGKVGGFYEGAPLLLLTTTGRKSGKPYTVPLAYQTDKEQNRLIVIAANVGANKNPDWYYNLITHPEVTVEIGTETLPAQTILVEGEAREHFLAIGRASWAEAMEREPELTAMATEEEHHIPVIAISLAR